jgi:hypothetical protein
MVKYVRVTITLHQKTKTDLYALKRDLANEYSWNLFMKYLMGQNINNELMKVKMKNR